MKTACPSTTNDAKVGTSIVSAKATPGTRPFDPSKPRQKKSGGHIQTAAWKTFDSARAGILG